MESNNFKISMVMVVAAMLAVMGNASFGPKVVFGPEPVC